MMNDTNNTRSYIISFHRGAFGREEYDGGHSIDEARKEAAFFRANLPSDTEITIYYVTKGDQSASLRYFERA